jgi:hypothetical protein
MPCYHLFLISEIEENQPFGSDLFAPRARAREPWPMASATLCVTGKEDADARASPRMTIVSGLRDAWTCSERNRWRDPV